MSRNRRVRAFIRAYTTNGYNGTQAAKSAGYSKKTAHAQACRLLKDADVKVAIEAAEKKAAEKCEVKKDEIIRGLLNQATFDVRDLFDEDGEMIPVQDLPDHVATSLAGIEVSEKGRVVKVKIPDRQGSLKLLGMTRAMFIKREIKEDGKSLEEILAEADRLEAEEEGDHE